MQFRHLRYFVAVAEELHFGRAAERLHIEQSPLSRAIRDLEDDLGARLFERKQRKTTTTRAGDVLLRDARRLLSAVEQARINVQAAASGYHGWLRVAVSAAEAQPRLSTLLAQSREEEPDVGVHLFEVPLERQLNGLREDLFDVGFAQTLALGDDLVAEPIWSDPLVLAIPARHPLLSLKRVPLKEVLPYPLVLPHPQAGSGCHQQIDRLLQKADGQPIIASHVMSLDMMLTLVSAGYGIGFVNSVRTATHRYPEVVIRPLAQAPKLTTYLVRLRTKKPSEQLERFINRVRLSNHPIAEDPH